MIYFVSVIVIVNYAAVFVIRLHAVEINRTILEQIYASKRKQQPAFADLKIYV